MKRTKDFDGKTCAYCGKTREVVRFFIGAQPLPVNRKGEYLHPPVEWTMHEGTAKLSCDTMECHLKGEAEAAAVIAKL